MALEDGGLIGRLARKTGIDGAGTAVDEMGRITLPHRCSRDPRRDRTTITTLPMAVASLPI